MVSYTDIHNYMNQMEKKNIMQDRNKDIRSRNDKGQAHGYWEVYWKNNINKQWYKSFYVNGSVYGYSEINPTSITNNHINKEYRAR